jgi:4a-hydroxytetrahydrobiopterin dehydratase
MPIPKLTDTELNEALASLTGWSIRNAKLHREFRFPDFIHAFGFMALCAPAIEKMNHHPEWFNVYGTVIVDLTTHDAGGVTKRDTELARLLDRNAERFV